MKQKKNKKRWIYNIAILFFLGVMIFSLWNLIPLLIQDHRDNETQKEMVQMVEKKQEDDRTVALEPDWKKITGKQSGHHRMDLCPGYGHQLSDRAKQG